jgi:hypothetical protein
MDELRRVVAEYISFGVILSSVQFIRRQRRRDTYGHAYTNHCISLYRKLRFFFRIFLVNHSC